MLPTPKFSHLSYLDYEHVYEPAEDTFLLIDALEKDAFTIKNQRPLLCVEIGSGSGLVITFLALLLEGKAYFMCTDINERASNASLLTGAENGIHLEPVITDLLESMEMRLHGQIDILLFNPPYVVTPSDEVGNKDISAAWAGGVNGREVIDRLIPNVAKLLSPSGIFYLLINKENNEQEISNMFKKQGLLVTTLLSRRNSCEHLSVLKVTHS